MIFVVGGVSQTQIVGFGGVCVVAIALLEIKGWVAAGIELCGSFECLDICTRRLFALRGGSVFRDVSMTR